MAKFPSTFIKILGNEHKTKDLVQWYKIFCFMLFTPAKKWAQTNDFTQFKGFVSVTHRQSPPVRCAKIGFGIVDYSGLVVN